MSRQMLAASIAVYRAVVVVTATNGHVTRLAVGPYSTSGPAKRMLKKELASWRFRLDAGRIASVTGHVESAATAWELHY